MRKMEPCRARCDFRGFERLRNVSADQERLSEGNIDQLNPRVLLPRRFKLVE